MRSCCTWSGNLRRAALALDDGMTTKASEWATRQGRAVQKCGISWVEWVGLGPDELRLISGEEREQARIRGSAPPWWSAVQPGGASVPARDASAQIKAAIYVEAPGSCWAEQPAMTTVAPSHRMPRPIPSSSRE
ncbi:GM14410 [Drosophila sechellia]|uniref:GM14410 n=1 Tax=Drosophila sechellia TaxID=7238 RepID=B4HVT1_DROSE|nr:GM14410 [Drosophila sechellia]